MRFDFACSLSVLSVGLLTACPSPVTPSLEIGVALVGKWQAEKSGESAVSQSAFFSLDGNYRTDIDTAACPATMPCNPVVGVGRYRLEDQKLTIDFDAPFYGYTRFDLPIRIDGDVLSWPVLQKEADSHYRARAIGSGEQLSFTAYDVVLNLDGTFRYEVDQQTNGAAHAIVYSGTTTTTADGVILKMEHQELDGNPLPFVAPDKVTMNLLSDDAASIIRYHREP